jgi:hypothetical protein
MLLTELFFGLFGADLGGIINDEKYFFFLLSFFLLCFSAELFKKKKLFCRAFQSIVHKLDNLSHRLLSYLIICLLYRQLFTCSSFVHVTAPNTCICFQKKKKKKKIVE